MFFDSIQNWIRADKPLNSFICGDCMEGMGQFSDNYFDLAIVDPPYGLGGKIVDGGSVSPLIKKSNSKVKKWDKKPNAKYFKELKRISKHQIIWGGNNFISHLDDCRCFIVWDKTIHGNSYSDCDLALSSMDKPARIYTKNIVRVTQDGRIHPTQKPIQLYQWLLKNYGQAGWKILDTHVGSASSLIACWEMGFDFVGFEIDKDYFKDACARMTIERKKMRQQDIFKQHTQSVEQIQLSIQD